MASRFIGISLAAALCFMTASCDDGGGANSDQCLAPDDLTESVCLTEDILGPPGLCEPLECASDTMEFTIPPDDPEDCSRNDLCDILVCNGSSLVFSGLRINEDGKVAGTVIINVDESSEPFICH